MDKDFLPYDIALELKQLGFNEPCFGYYVDGELRGINLGMEELGGVEPYYQRFGFHTLSNHDIDNPNKIVVTVPTFSQAFRWFREKYGLFVAPNAISYENGPYLWFFEVNSTILSFGIDLGETDDFENYEEAELACLIKLIELVKNK
jgi:hypothetical protein